MKVAVKFSSFPCLFQDLVGDMVWEDAVSGDAVSEDTVSADMALAVMVWVDWDSAVTVEDSAVTVEDSEGCAAAPSADMVEASTAERREASKCLMRTVDQNIYSKAPLSCTIQIEQRYMRYANQLSFL